MTNQEIFTTVQHCDTHFLLELQEIHDKFQPDAWPEKLARFAKEHGLNYE